MASIEQLEQLTAHEIELLKNFEEQLETIYPHEKHIYRLIRRIKQLREAVEKNKKDKVDELKSTIQKLITLVKSEALQKFDILKKEPKQEEKLLWEERSKKSILLGTENILKNTYNSLFVEEAKLKQAAFKKIKRVLRNTKKEIEETERGISINEHIILLLKKLHEFSQTLYNDTAYEYDLLKSIDLENLSKDNLEKLGDIEGKLRVLSSQIKTILRTEKYEVYKPLMKLIGVETGGMNEFQKIKQKEKITWEDIKSDIYTMQEPDEILEYISALESHKELIEVSALPHIRNYKTRAREIAEKSKKETVVDSLTGLFTRKLLFAELKNLTAIAGGKKDAFSLIMIDIDYFKQVNDAFGHPTGDRILRRVGALIRSAIRGQDIACRYGGEEFTIILPRTGTEKASEIAERIRISVSSFDFKLEGRPVTISAGVSTYGVDDTNSEKLLAIADNRLLIAKKIGRNTVVSS